MADGYFATLVSANEDLNTLTNQMFTQITDGTTGISVNVAQPEDSILLIISDLKPLAFQLSSS